MINDLGNTFLLLYLAIPSIRGKVLPHLRESLFATKLQRILFNTILKNRDNGYIPIMDFVQSLQEGGMDDGIVNGFLKLSESFDSNLGKEDESVVIKKITEFIKKREVFGVLHSINDTGKIDVDYLTPIFKRIIDFTIDSFKIDDFSKAETVNNSQKKLTGQIMKSSFPSINDGFTYGGYRGGELTLYCGAPGYGKTFLWMSEASLFIRSGLKVLAIYLGDISPYSAFLRFLSNFSGIESNQLILNGYQDAYSSYSSLFSNLRTVCLPALTWNADELIANVESIRKNSFKFDALFIDYDLNIRKSSGEMYEEGGQTYAKIAKYANEEGIMTGIVSQIKSWYWNQEIIPLDAPSESSRKPHIVDNQFGIGKINKRCPVGLLNINKMREGADGGLIPIMFNYSKGNVYQIGIDEYQKLKDFYSTGDISKLIGKQKG